MTAALGQMTFDEFLEFFFAKLDSLMEGARSNELSLGRQFQTPGQLASFFDMIKKARLFHLGLEAHLLEALVEIHQDLLSEAEPVGYVPMPFEAMGMIWKSEELGWVFDWLFGRRPAGDPQGPMHYVSAKLTEKDLREDQIRETLGFTLDFARRAEGAWIQFEADRWVDIDRPGETPRVQSATYTQLEIDSYAQEVTRTLAACMAISHPYFYVVETTSRLTPKEERRLASKGIYPDQKRPRFTVVDYTGLLELRSKKSAENAARHSSPVPHERPRHWRRLAERCLEARAEGKTRTWIRPATVGEIAWSDARRHYKVILDPLGKGGSSAVGRTEMPHATLRRDSRSDPHSEPSGRRSPNTVH